MIKGLTAICGGIGSGKSVVAHIVSSMGYDVYDCDMRARHLMDNDFNIKECIRCEIGEACVVDGKINRPVLADIVFKDDAALNTLNRITHSAVKQDLRRWTKEKLGSGMPDKRLFVETAILYQSGLDRLCEEVWEVTAPIDIRIERVMHRNGLSREQVVNRIESQSFTPSEYHGNVNVIVNDGVRAVLPQVERLLASNKEVI